jgi:hypothetical protein
MNKAIIQSYVHHREKCFFVSTIERTSSAALNPCRYNETLVWDWDAATRERGEMVHQGEDTAGSIANHLETCDALHSSGTL